MTEAYIGLGANLGDAAQTLLSAVRSIDALPATRVTRCSSIYQSAPIDATGPDYLNSVVAIQTALDAPELFGALLQIEQEFGRQRPFRNAPRTLDLDLLLFGDSRINTPSLTVPHPRMHERAFVLEPLAQIAPDLALPGLPALALLLKRCSHQKTFRMAAIEPGQLRGAQVQE